MAAIWIKDWDYWTAFGLLPVLGLSMVWAGLSSVLEPDHLTTDQSSTAIAFTALATSIGAMAVGVGLAFVDVSIVQASVMTALATFVMVLIDVMPGRALSGFIGRRAEAVGPGTDMRRLRHPQGRRSK